MQLSVPTSILIFYRNEHGMKWLHTIQLRYVATVASLTQNNIISYDIIIFSDLNIPLLLNNVLTKIFY